MPRPVRSPSAPAGRSMSSPGPGPSPPPRPAPRPQPPPAGPGSGPPRLIGADTGEIALPTNTSYGLNLAARMIPFEPGDVVLVSNGEFPANVFPWRHLGDRGVTM